MPGLLSDNIRAMASLWGFSGSLYFFHMLLCFPRRLDLVNIAGMQLVPINALMCLIVIIIGWGENIK